SALIRVPRAGSGDRASVRNEFRAPDPSCNPYLAFAAMLHAGLSGIRQKLPLPPPVEENLYAFDPERLARHQLGHLPASLAEAFIAPNPLVRIGLRSLPALPVAIWTLWFETSRPLEGQRPLLRVAGRIALLVLVMAFAVAILGIGLNWLYDPNRFI